MQGVPCKSCHQEVFAEYKDSVHGKARSNGGMSAAPICSTCHFAHDVQAAVSSRSPKELCLGCHANVVGLHKEWLPNTEAHFDSVACTACHISAEYQRSVYLRVTDSSTGALVSDVLMRNVLGKNVNETSNSKDEHLEPKQIWDMYRKLNENGGNVTMSGTISLVDGKQAHYIGPKGKAIQTCEYCHNADSDVFKNVSITTLKKNGRENKYALDSATLGSAFAMLPLGQFYAIGGTRIWLLDAIGVAMVLGGAAVPLIHGTARILTRKRRIKHR
jgi:predicted CXXCH cytochrome family protein